MTPLQSRLEKFEACHAATAWVGEKDLVTAWAGCPRGDWLLWFAAKAGVDRKLLVRAACACARTALKFVPDGELRPLQAIEAAESWCRGEATIEEVQAAAYAAYAASHAASAYAYYAAAAAYAAAYAASHAASHAYSSSADAYAASAAASVYSAAAAADAASHAAHAAARTVARAECADLVRGIIKLEDLGQ